MHYRKLIAIVLGLVLLARPNLAISQTTGSSTYFVSSSGSDSNNGTSMATPWKTLTKVNQTTFKPGDSILFKRGDSFYGGLIVSQSGTAADPIIFGAYGSGALPLITGFTNVTTWTNLGSNIWESANAVSTLPTLNMVVINGVNTAMGRFPNTGTYLIYQSRLVNTSITSSSLTGTPNWTGAELVFFSTTYRVARHPITGQSGGTLTYTPTPNRPDLFQSPSTYFVQNFFIQNDPRTLDAQNEWYYNPSTKKLRIFSASQPTNVQVASVDTLVWTNHKNYITFDSLAYQGSNRDAVEIGQSANISIQNSTFNFIGGDAVYATFWGGSWPGLKVENNTINNVNNMGLDISKYFNNATIRGNTVTNIGMLIGMNHSSGSVLFNVTPNDNMATGISSTGDNSIIDHNIVNNTGYIGINYLGNGTVVSNNYVQNFCMGNGVKDGGGIYTWNDGRIQDVTKTKTINNIVLNGGLFSSGLYFDDKSNGIEIAGNSSANTERGIYMHNAWTMNVHDNTTFNNTESELMMNADNSAVTMNNITIKNNVFVAKTATERTIWNSTINTATMALPFTSDNNYFARPIDDNLSVQTYFNGVYSQRNLSGWQTLNAQDTHSKKSPKAITDVKDLRFEYNATDHSKTITLDANYIDVKNVLYPGTVTLAPWSSVVLIKTTGTVPPPADTTPPVVSLAVSTTGTVSGTITVSATATDNVGITKVELYKDNDTAPFATDSSSPYSAAFDTKSLPNGTHTLKAVAYDPANNKSTSQPVAITVSNIIPDTTAPTVSITNPTGGTVSGTIIITATASDNVGVSLIEFYKDSDTARFITDTTSPYSVTLDTTRLTNGTHTFKAIAYDAASNTKTSATVSVTVNNNTPDTTAPIVAITSPTGGTVSGTMTITANASDNVGVSLIEFYKDSDATRFITDTTSPYTVSLDTTTLANGTHTIKAIAYDAAKNSKTSQIVSVTVNNSSLPPPPASDTTAPTVSLTSPSSGRTVWGIATLSATASDNIGVTKVEFYQGASLVGSDTSSPYSFSWNTRSVPNGSYTLKAVAYDKAGNKKDSQVATVSVKNFRWRHR